ncbi:MAG: hypothetical protein NT051_02015 [Candidatus Micrarchaeota archaeon]|nr:hypothetical protein [Candidatus Micrarchaeota archaeon]
MYLLTSFCSDWLSAQFLTNIITPIVITSLATMIFVLALFYMAANFFRKNVFDSNPDRGNFFRTGEYESFVSIELHQLLISALIFVTVFGASCFAADLSDKMAGGDMFEISRNYLNMISNQIALPYIVKLEVAKMVAQYFSSMSFRWGLAVWGAMVPGFPAFIVIERVIDFLLILLTPFVASLMVQEIVLEVIRAISLPFILPAGVVLRIFPPTRTAGAFLIAAAIAFEIIFPYTYVMHSNIMNTLIQSENTEEDVRLGGVLTGTPNLAYAISDGGLWNPEDTLIKPLRYLSYMIMQAVFLPALSITITIAFIKGTTKFINQKLD